MNEPLDELYLRWLYAAIGSVKLRNPSRTYWALARQLYTKEFVWIIPNDDNRVEDGRDLRYEFMDDCGIQTVDGEWMDLGCSMLEMLVSLSRHLAFEDGRIEPRGWFWRLMENLDLEEYTDRNYNGHQDAINEVLDRIIWRTYSYDGREGGLFPLENPHQDQREVEIWYQLNAYLLEHE